MKKTFLGMSLLFLLFPLVACNDKQSATSSTAVEATPVDDSALPENNTSITTQEAPKAPDQMSTDGQVQNSSAAPEADQKQATTANGTDFNDDGNKISYKVDQAADQAQANIDQAAQDVKQDIKKDSDTVKKKAAEISQKGKAAVNDIDQKVSNTAQQIKEKAAESNEITKQQIKELGQDTKDSLNKTAEKAKKKCRKRLR